MAFLAGGELSPSESFFQSSGLRLVAMRLMLAGQVE